MKNKISKEESINDNIRKYYGSGGFGSSIRAKIRRKNDPSYRLLNNQRNRVWKALKRNGGVKSTKTVVLIGCSINMLVVHLEKKFRDGMTWENYGAVWHVDHIIPCVNFDLSDTYQQKKCFNYTNLQPLFCLENILKGIK